MLLLKRLSRVNRARFIYSTVSLAIKGKRSSGFQISTDVIFKFSILKMSQLGKLSVCREVWVQPLLLRRLTVTAYLMYCFNSYDCYDCYVLLRDWPLQRTVCIVVRSAHRFECWRAFRGRTFYCWLLAFTKCHKQVLLSHALGIVKETPIIWKKNPHILF